jgi:hypothetical protein
MASDIAASLIETKRKLVRRASTISLRRFAIMQSIFSMHKRKIGDVPDEKAPKKKGVSLFSPKAIIELMSKS